MSLGIRKFVIAQFFNKIKNHEKLTSVKLLSIDKLLFKIPNIKLETFLVTLKI